MAKKQKKSKRLIAHVGLKYAADEKSLRALKEKGLRNMSPAEVERLNWKFVEKGGDCTDHPKGTQLTYLLGCGDVEEVEVEEE